MLAVRSIIRWVLVLALVVGTQQTLIVEGLFLARQDTISTHFCVNKDRPDMECNGKCFLAKRVGDVHGTHDHTAVQQSHRPALQAMILLPLGATIKSPVQPVSYPPPVFTPPISRVDHDIFRPPWEG
jgi:hypothetical protein